MGNGYGYSGQAERGESGAACQPWNRPELNFVLAHGQLVGEHNYCRNPDNDTSPWSGSNAWTTTLRMISLFSRCVVPGGEFDYCDIPPCQNEVELNSLLDGKCQANEYKCQAEKCIPGEYLCDGIR